MKLMNLALKEFIDSWDIFLPKIKWTEELDVDFRKRVKMGVPEENVIVHNIAANGDPVFLTLFKEKSFPTIRLMGLQGFTRFNINGLQIKPEIGISLYEFLKPFCCNLSDEIKQTPDP